MLVRIKNSKTGTVMSVPDPSVMGPGWEVVTDGSGDSAGRGSVDAPASVRDGDAVSSDLLERAERLLLARIPDLLERVASGRPSLQLVADIEAEMVARVLRAPDNGIMRQEAEGNYSYSLNLQVASGLLDVLGKEWEALGLGSWGSLAPESDGYARQRWGGEVPYPWRFQYAWPARDEVSESWGGWVR